MVISSFSQNRLLGNDSNYHNPSPQTRRFLAAVVHFTPQSRASSFGPLGGVTGRATAEPGSMSVCLSVCVWAQKLGLSPRVWTREGSLERCQAVRSYRLCHDLALCWNVFSQCVCVFVCVYLCMRLRTCVCGVRGIWQMWFRDCFSFLWIILQSGAECGALLRGVCIRDMHLCTLMHVFCDLLCIRICIYSHTCHCMRAPLCIHVGVLFYDGKI